MSSSGDICEVSKDKHEDLRKVEYLCEAINTIEGRKGKRKPPLRGVYKDVEVEEAKMNYFYSKNSLHLETLGIILDMFCFYDWHSITRRTRKGGSFSCSTLSIELRSV